jgi:hypothetical protein
MPATAAQVFGPVTVDPGFNTTGEKTLLTMNTTLPPGGKNVIIVTLMFNGNVEAGMSSGTFRIKKGTTILYETPITVSFGGAGARAYPPMFIAMDNSPNGNDVYSFMINITTAGHATGSAHVQGIVIKADDAVWGYNTVAVSIPVGTTSTVVNISTSFPSGSKVVVIAVAYGYYDGYSQHKIGAGNVK